MSIYLKDATGSSQAGLVGTEWLYAMDRNPSGGEVDLLWMYTSQDVPWFWIGAQRRGELKGNWFRLRDLKPNACFELAGIHAPIQGRESDPHKQITVFGKGGSLSVTIFGGSLLAFTWADGSPCGHFSVGELVRQTTGIFPLREIA